MIGFLKRRKEQRVLEIRQREDAVIAEIKAAEDLEKTARENYKKGIEEIAQAEERASQYLLTVSASDYVACKGKYLSDYDLRSVDGRAKGSGTAEFWDLTDILVGTIAHAKKKMIEKAEKLGAEVVVDVRPSISYDFANRAISGLVGDEEDPVSNVLYEKGREVMVISAFNRKEAVQFGEAEPNYFHNHSGYFLQKHIVVADIMGTALIPKKKE